MLAVGIICLYQNFGQKYKLICNSVDYKLYKDLIQNKRKDFFRKYAGLSKFPKKLMHEVNTEFILKKKQLLHKFYLEVFYLIQLMFEEK
jgi:hypothetical protein